MQVQMYKSIKRKSQRQYGTFNEKLTSEIRASIATTIVQI